MKHTSNQAARWWRRLRVGLKRRGAFLPVAAMSLASASVVVALGVDLSVVSLTRQKMQNACDAAALAASQEITAAVAQAGQNAANNGSVGNTVADANAIATAAAKTMAVKVAAANGVYVDPERDVTFGKRVYDANTGGYAISWGASPFNVVKVSARRDNPEQGHPDSELDLFFAGVTDQGTASITTSAIAFVEARDIVMILDYSASMNDDSTFSRFSTLGQSAVEANMSDIWTALGPPSAGTMVFTPAWLKQTNSSGDFSGTGTFRNTAVDLSWSKNYTTVKLTFSTGSTQTFSSLAVKTGTYQGSGSNAGKVINQVDVTGPAVTQVQNKTEPTGVAKTGGTNPVITVTTQGSTISVSSPKTLQNVVLKFADGTTQTFSGLTSKTGSFAGTGSNAGKWVANSWVESNNQVSGDGPNYGIKFVNPNGSDWPLQSQTNTVTLSLVDSAANVQSYFQLTGTYPYYAGSWSDYINYVRTNSNVSNAGYARKYGGLTFVQYVLENYPAHAQTQDLWKTPHYPFYPMKRGATLFTQFLAGLQFGDHLGLVTYADTATIETVLNDADIPDKVDLGTDWITDNYTAINTIQTHKQAGHYTSRTNMADGIVKAKYLLDNKKRYGARPTIILMTDGIANLQVSGWSLPSTWNWDKLTDWDGDGKANYTTTDTYKLCAFVKAKECYDAGITVHTLTIGQAADRDFMKAVAFACGGQWIDVPAGLSFSDTQTQMMAAFTKIAANVPPAKILVDPSAN